MKRQTPQSALISPVKKTAMFSLLWLACKVMVLLRMPHSQKFLAREVKPMMLPRTIKQELRWGLYLK
jgi:hypothetical protein